MYMGTTLFRCFRVACGVHHNLSVRSGFTSALEHTSQSKPVTLLQYQHQLGAMPSTLMSHLGEHVWESVTHGKTNTSSHHLTSTTTDHAIHDLNNQIASCHAEWSSHKRGMQAFHQQFVAAAKPHQLNQHLSVTNVAARSPGMCVTPMRT
eukprot:66057-Amphidinium_carterae.2